MKTMDMSKYKKRFVGGVEAGGTKFICAIGTPDGEVHTEIRLPTTTPAETLAETMDFFKQHAIDALGIACFGPLDLHTSSITYGHITATPKPGWTDTDILGILHRELNIPATIDTDVNAAAISEYSALPDKTIQSLVYLTIGTGIGAGIMVNGQIIHGLTHPEIGHMLLAHDLEKDPFPGSCNFHLDCFEGLASGPAIAHRWRMPAENIPHEHPAWELETDYIAKALTNVILTISPEKIILGGGVMQQNWLLPIIRKKVSGYLNGYVPSPVFLGDLSSFIKTPHFGVRSGIIGALMLAGSIKPARNVT